MNLNDKRYRKFVDQSGVFDNTFENAYPQTVVAKIVRKHLQGTSQKKKRVLIYGFDGARGQHRLSCPRKPGFLQKPIQRGRLS